MRVKHDGDASATTSSWRRCINVHRLDPDSRSVPRTEPVALRDARERDRVLREISAPCLDQLYALLADADCAVFLTDRSGRVLDLRTNRRQDVWGLPPDGWLGRSYAESEIGTNGIGTCLAEERGVIIRGEEHFFTCLVGRVGIAAPLFGPHGALVGCLALDQNIEAHDARLDTFLSISLANFARRIETEMFARAHPAKRLVLASPKGQKPDALLAIDDDDRVVGATRSARRLLALGDETLAGAPSVTEIYKTTTGCPGQVLADVERRTIARALARSGGNLSAAARTMGISRSTLYRKLKTYAGATAPGAIVGLEDRQTSVFGLKSSSVLMRLDRPSRTSR